MTFLFFQALQTHMTTWGLMGTPSKNFQEGMLLHMFLKTGIIFSRKIFFQNTFKDP